MDVLAGHDAGTLSCFECELSVVVVVGVGVDGGMVMFVVRTC